jgi:hypothetical protein
MMLKVLDRCNSHRLTALVWIGFTFNCGLHNMHLERRSTSSFLSSTQNARILSGIEFDMAASMFLRVQLMKHTFSLTP